MNTPPRTFLTLVCALPLFTGCIDSELDDTVSTETLELAPPPIDFNRCGATGCGLNGPDTDGHGYADLNTFGKVNELGYYISSASLRRQRLSLRVAGTTLIGSTSTDSRVIGNELINARIYIRNVFAPGMYWTLRITDYDHDVPYWIGSEVETIASYRFAASANGGSEVNLCNDGVNDDYEQLHHALIFEGDRYDRTAKTVRNDSFTSGWFNLACSGSTASKLLRLRHARVAADGDIITTGRQRTALYKSIVGDFGGDGNTLTQAGVPLFLRLAENWGWNFGCIMDSHEAIWDEYGAVCVEVYRLADDPVLSQQLDDYGIPDCTSEQLTHYGDYGWVRTTNPGALNPDNCVMFQ